MSLDDIDDDELVRQFKQGDTDAFDEIVRRFQDRIYRLACIWLIDTQQAADVTQEVFVRSYNGLKKFRFRAAPFTWLYRTTRFVCNEFNRRHRYEPIDKEPIDNSAGPELVVQERQCAARIRELIDVLPERQQEVVMLRVFEDLSVKATAAAMGCREGTVKALLHKAMRRLRMESQEMVEL